MSIINLSEYNVFTWAITVLIGFVTYKLAKFYVKVWSLPSGPLPIPVLGNILNLRGTKDQAVIEIARLKNKYGPIFTFWLGPNPYIMIFDLDLAKDAFRRNEFAGRPDINIAKLLVNENSDVVFTDYGPTWESLRRVTHNAVRKYAVSDKLAYLVSDVVDETVNTILEKEGNKAFDPFNYIYLTVLNIVASSAVGKRYEMESKEFKKIKHIFVESAKEAVEKAYLAEFVPIFRLIYYSLLKKFENTFKEHVNVLCKEYKKHYDDYNKDVIRDFCDALIFAKNEALNEGKESAPYLTDENLALVINDLYLAGTDTTQRTIKWIFLFMANYTDVQVKMRQEIDSVIGDRMPVQEDRNNCHFVNAVISEVLRIRNVVPMGVFHKTVVDCQLGGHKIPKDTGVFVHQYDIMNNEKYWNDPHIFKPERFLEDGKYLTSRPQAFIPFGLGRRVCPGEKMAIADMFLILVRFLQRTSEYMIEVEGGAGSADLEADENIPDSLVPKNYKIILKKL